MTVQAEDKFIYRGRICSIDRGSGYGNDPDSELFDIKQVGLNPTGESTANWRGYVATFGLEGDKLLLMELSTNNGNREKGNSESPIVKINGVKPEIVEPYWDNSACPNFRYLKYREVNLPLLFTGTITIRREPYRFESLPYSLQFIELHFEEGTLVAEKDLSEKMADKRKSKTTSAAEQFLLDFVRSQDTEQ